MQLNNSNKMKKKTIKKICRNKIQSWIDSVGEQKVKDAISNGAFITGGSIVSMLLKEEVNDFDVYIKTKEDLKTIVDYYCRRVNGNNNAGWAKPGGDQGNVLVPIDGADWQGENAEHIHSDGSLSVFLSTTAADRIRIFIYGGFWAADGKDGSEGEEANEENENKYTPVYITPNAITLSDKLQLVVRFWGNPDKVHENYDFVHATSYYDFSSNRLHLNQGAIESIMTKELIYIGSLYPITSLIRAKKFALRGWSVSAGTYLKIAFQVSKLDLTDINVLEEQLAGVDVAYFGKLIDALRSKKENEPEFQITEGYLFEVIDRIFGDSE